MIFIEHGKCFVCGNNVDFQIEKGFSLREVGCPICQGTKRSRDLAKAIIKTYLKDETLSLAEGSDYLRELAIYEAQASGPIHEYLSKLPKYTCSEYFDNVPPGSVSGSGIRCEDLRRLTFPNDSFDLVITQDVFEHINNPEKAFLEIKRVLKPGGHHIFTVPVHEGRKTVRRVMIKDGKKVFLLPPVHHLGPLRESGSLVYTDFGDDIIDNLISLGLPTEIALHENFYQPDAIPCITDDSSYKLYLESKQKGDLLKYFLYNSVVFRSKKEDKAEMLEWTGERYVPWADDTVTGYEHLHRYRLAKEFVKGKKVLDLACGEGYGSFMLAEEANEVIGIDIDETTIRHASSKYIKKNLEFIKGSITNVPIKGENIFDVVVCFEALEHIEDHDGLMKEVKRLLKEKGMFIVSTPNRYIYSEQPNYQNPFHLKELYFDEFKELLSKYFENILIYGQKVYPSSNIFPLYKESSPTKDFPIEKGDKEFLFVSPDKKLARYFIAVASDSSMDKNLVPGNSYLLDLSETLIQQKDAHISHLEGVVREKEAEVEGLIAELRKLSTKVDEAYSAIEAMNRSRSWRVTAPLRKIAGWLRRVSDPKPRCNLFSCLVIAACTLPATFFHYESFNEWKKAMLSGKSYFRAVLNRPTRCRESLTKLPTMLGMPVSALLSVALRIRRNKGVLPSLRNLYRIARKEGRYGIFARLTAYAPAPVVIAQPPQGRPRVLVMDYRIPMPDISAGELLTVGILHDLCTFGFDVVLLPNNMTPAPGYEEALQRAGVTVITGAHGYHSSNHYLSEQGHTFSAFYLIRVHVAETVLDVIRQVAPHARILFHALDVQFLREGREAELKKDPTLRARAEATRERELAIMRRADHTVIVSPAELPVLRRYLPDVPISVFPALYAPVASRPTSYNARKDIFFLGGYTHTPNVDAVCWFVTETWPLVRKQLPGAVFHIVGSEAPQTVLDLVAVPGVEVDGFVKNLTPVLSSMRVSVAPLRFGAGIKGKVAMAMGAGIPCVCTSIAAEGMGLEDGVHTRVTDDPREFADAVVRLYKDRGQWEQLSSNGRDLVRRHFGEEANRASLLAVLNDANALPLQLLIDYCKTLKPRPMPSPSADEAVDVSIIIPVYNQWDYTRVCLNSILETCRTVGIRYEVILADDGSSDETTLAAKHYPGLRVIKTPNNVGFLRNCNHAAKHARGKHILLLNNDTVVLPGWLTALYQLMEEDESAAIVGSKLLYPDGTIQEAGAVLWNDGTVKNCGRSLSPRNEPNFAYVREVDYISACSILVRKSFWDSVGGFDELYENAYCEDCDMAMTARAQGLRVLYQPKSEVIHFENKSYTGERTDGFHPIQRANTQRLREKWRAEFDTAHLPPNKSEQEGILNAERSPSPASQGRRGQGRLNVLFFSPFPSHPECHGNQFVIQQFGRRFQSLGHKVHFALLQSHLISQDAVGDMRACWDTLDILPNANSLLANGEAVPFDGWYEEGLGERIRALCAKYDIDVVFCAYVFQSKLLEFLPAHILKVIDTNDKMGNRYEMLRANRQPLEFFSCTPEEEGAYLQRADVVIALREEEARYFDSVSGRNSAIVIPHVEDPRFVEKTFSGLKNVGMVASANRINLTITRVFLDAVDSRLQGRNCPFTVHIAGQVRDMVADLPRREAKVFRKPWVRMYGFIPDIAKFYADMDVIVSPVTMGTGINIKTVQAMAFGMPLITTACGSKGIETGDPMHSHSDLDALADTLLSLTNRPDELQRLAAISRARYTTFYESSLAAMPQIFMHPKLTKGRKWTFIPEY